MAADGMNNKKKSIVEIIQLSESYTDIPSSSSSGSCEAAAPRISFSKEEAAEVAAEEDCSASSSEAEFEFSKTGFEAQASTADAISMADELFYNGKLLPLEPMSRMAMVQDLSQEEEIVGTMRRGRSTRAPARAHFQVGPCTRKSSSYPPPGCSSRPSPTRKWKDLFGLKKQQQQHQAEAAKPTSSSNTLLKMVFSNKGSSSATTAPYCNEAPSPAPKNQGASSRASSDAHSQNRPRKSQAPIKLGHAGGIRAAAAITADAHKLSPPPSPLRTYAKASVNVAPVLHVPAYITSLKPFRRESRSPVEVL